MRATSIVIVAGAVLLAVTWLFLIALLRSHAEILRRLHAIERREGFALDDGADDGADAAADPRVVYAGSAAADAPDIVGETLAGDVVKLTLGPGAPRTLLAFLGTGCSVCGPLWEELRAGGPVAPGIRVVVVTKGSDRESLTRLHRIAPGGDLVMSNAAWSDYGITATPHFVLIDSGARRILGRGGGTSWSQILSLLADAQSDAELHRARSTSERAERAEQALAASGIEPDHPSLYPSRQGETDE